MSEHDVSFRAMGSDVRLLIGEPSEAGLPSAEEAAARAREYVERFDARLSRFRADSELSALNRDPREVVPASGLLRSAVAAGLWAARYSGGLVDPTLLGPLEDAGYRESRAGEKPAPLAAALAAAPASRPGSPHPARAWERIQVDDQAAVIRRPAGLRFDTGGSGKGLCADAVAHTLRGYSRFVVDCGGDLRVGGTETGTAPYEIQIANPFGDDPAATVEVSAGAIATSGIDSRLWPAAGGGYAHHLIDPATGTPAWTGLVAATALAPSALEAETLAKMALLSGPAAARRLLRDRGGALAHEDGRVELLGSVARRPLMRVQVRRPLGRAA